MSTTGRILGGVATVLLVTSCSLLQPTPDDAPSVAEPSPSPESAEPKLSQEGWESAVQGLMEVGGMHSVWIGVAEWDASGEYVMAAAFPGAGQGQMEWHWADSEGEVRESIALGAGGEITVPLTEYTYQQARDFLDAVGECAPDEVRMWAARPMPSGVWQEYGGCAAENRVAQDRGATPGLYNVVPVPQRVLLDGEPVVDLEDWASPEALAQIWDDGQAAMGADTLLRAISITPAYGGVSIVGSNGVECGGLTGFLFSRSLMPSDARLDLKPGNGALVAACAQGIDRGFRFADVSPEHVAEVAAQAVKEHGLDLDGRSGHLSIGQDAGALVMMIGQDTAVSHTYVLVPAPTATQPPA
ncbi:hypothetical protein [Tessaracoccus rhinocerotis]|nr:hypothetical protein [Tessaracoccus rhinocerotis]